MYQGYVAAYADSDPFGDSVFAAESDIAETAANVGYYVLGPKDKYKYFGMDSSGTSLLAYRVTTTCNPCQLLKNGKTCYKTESFFHVKFLALIRPASIRPGQQPEGVYGHEQKHIKHMIVKYNQVRKQIEQSFRGSWYDQTGFSPTSGQAVGGELCDYYNREDCEDGVRIHKGDFRKIHQLTTLMIDVWFAGAGHYRPWKPDNWKDSQGKTNLSLKDHPRVERTKTGEQGMSEPVVGDFIPVEDAPDWVEDNWKDWELRYSLGK